MFHSNSFQKSSYHRKTANIYNSEIAIIPTKRLRNQIAGFITHLMKRIRAGPVRGISIKLQEEERYVLLLPYHYFHDISISRVNSNGIYRVEL